jgi:hypothetical protein
MRTNISSSEEGKKGSEKKRRKDILAFDINTEYVPFDLPVYFSPTFSRSSKQKSRKHEAAMKEA